MAAHQANRMSEQGEPILTVSELNQILDGFEPETPELDRPDRRSQTRGRRRLCDVTLEVDHIGGGSSTLYCCTRNISAFGISLITNVFIHPNSSLRVTLNRNDGNAEIIPGRATHSRHIEGRYHEVGIHFTRKINPLLFLLADDNTDLFSSNSAHPPEGLAGRVVYISPYTTDADLFLCYVSGTDVFCKDFTDTGPAIDELRKSMYDLVILDVDAAEYQATDAAAAIRASGFIGEIISISADEDLQIEATNSPAINDTLNKPFPLIALQCKIAASFERTAKLSTYEQTHSTISPDSPMMLLVPKYIAELNAIAQRIEGLISSDDIAKLTKSCLRIKGTGSSFGFAILADLASETFKQLKDTNSVHQSTPQLRRLAIMCRKAAP